MRSRLAALPTGDSRAAAEYPAQARKISRPYDASALIPDGVDAAVFGNRIDRVVNVTIDLSTTNMLLGIMAAVSVLEAIAIATLAVGGALACRKLIGVLRGIEQRQVAPAMSRVNAVLDDVKTVTSVVKEAAEDIDAGARWGLGAVLSWLVGKHKAA